MASGKLDAIEAARNVFKSIAGSPYRTNIQNRVYSRFYTPTEQPDIEKPWGVLQQLEPSAYEEPGNSQSRIWRMEAWFFFDENAESDPLNTAAERACHDFEDDVREAFIVDPRLNNTALRCNLISVNPIYGDTDDYAKVHVVLEIEQELEA